jgi:Protein of unknown function (DUF3987)
VGVQEKHLALVEAVAKAHSAGQTEQEPWPELDRSILSVHREAPPELPLDVLGPSWGHWVQVAAMSKGARPDYVAMALLSAIGALLANHRRVSPWDGWVEPPVVWAALVGNPSSGKSPALDAIAQPMQQLERERERERES